MARDRDRSSPRPGDAEDAAVLDELLERCGYPNVRAIERRRIQEREIGALCASLEAVGVPTDGLRRKLLLLTVERGRLGPALVIAILETEEGDPPVPHYVLRLVGEVASDR